MQIPNPQSNTIRPYSYHFNHHCCLYCCYHFDYIIWLILKRNVNIYSSIMLNNWPQTCIGTCSQPLAPLPWTFPQPRREFPWPPLLLIPLNLLEPPLIFGPLLVCELLDVWCIGHWCLDVNHNIERGFLFYGHYFTLDDL